MVDFRERLWAPWWAWPVAGSWPLTLGVAYGYATQAVVGWIVAGCLLLSVTVGMVRSAAVVEVSAAGLRAGRAFLEAEYLGSATSLNAQQARELRGPAADGRAFVVLRGWIPTAVRVAVDDARDPTPYWYVSSRDPEALAVAVNQARNSATVDVEGFNSGAPEHP